MHQIHYGYHVQVEARIADLAGSYRTAAMWSNPLRFGEPQKALGRGLIALGRLLAGPESPPLNTGAPVKNWN